MPQGKEDVPWPAVAAILTIARFCEPSSELHIEDTWYRRTALDDLLGVEPSKVHTDRLYDGLDQLLPHKDAIERHLRARLGELFDLKYDVLFYDITSTYFEGKCLGNPMAQRGYSRDSRPDCVQVCIGLIVTDGGMPLGYEVFDGNTNDSKTVQQMVEAMEAKYGRANRARPSGYAVSRRRTRGQRCSWAGWASRFHNDYAGSTRSHQCSHDFLPKTALARPPRLFSLWNSVTWANGSSKFQVSSFKWNVNDRRRSSREAPCPPHRPAT